MTKLDFSPLYRSTVGFDHLASLFDSIGSDRKQSSYPPYNIKRVKEDCYRITMAVAGFGEEDIEVMVEDGTLTVTARGVDSDSQHNYLYRGIAERNFTRQFRLETYVEVVSASLENGLLHIDLEREVPDVMKPRKVPIKTSSSLGRVLRSV